MLDWLERWLEKKYLLRIDVIEPQNTVFVSHNCLAFRLIIFVDPSPLIPQKRSETLPRCWWDRTVAKTQGVLVNCLWACRLLLLSTGQVKWCMSTSIISFTPTKFRNRDIETTPRSETKLWGTSSWCISIYIIPFSPTDKIQLLRSHYIH